MIHLNIEYFSHANKKDEEPVVIFLHFILFAQLIKGQHLLVFQIK